MIPSKIQVLGVPFNVELVKFEEEGQCGETLGIYRRIRISQDLDSKRQWSTLLHEYIHAVLYVMGAGVVLAGDLEECITQSLEHGIEQLLQQVGPELLTSLIEGE